MFIITAASRVLCFQSAAVELHNTQKCCILKRLNAHGPLFATGLKCLISHFAGVLTGNSYREANRVEFSTRARTGIWNRVLKYLHAS